MSFFFSSCEERIAEGSIVFTKVSGELHDINHATRHSWKYFPGSSIAAYNPNASGEKLKVLTGGYFSARSPEISYDGKRMVFAAQRKQNDIWQIWEMSLEDLSVRQVTNSKENCIDPAYMPGGRLVFSKFTIDDKIKIGHSLYTCDLDGSNIRQITYNPYAYFGSTTLKDGRILTISRQPYPEKDGMLMVLRPDGTKEELFYKGGKESTIVNRSCETNNGKILFIESVNNNQRGGNIIAVQYNRPLHSRDNLSLGMKGDFYTVSPIKSGRLLASYRSSDQDRYALYEFDMDNKMLQAVYKEKNYHIIEAVAVEKRERPKKLPSEVDPDKKIGLLLCQDINFSGEHLERDTASTSKAVKIELLGIDSSLGTVDVEKDGSVYLKVLADTPFRMQTIDEDGQVINGPSSWMYLRPNERRGCVGCHVNREQVPINIQPLSIRKDPIHIPVYKKEIHKNKDSLE